MVVFIAGLTKVSSPPSWIPKGRFDWIVANQFWLLVALPMLGLLLDYTRKHLDDAHHDRVRSRLKEKCTREVAEANSRKEEDLRALLQNLLRCLRDQFIPAEMRDDPPLNHRLTLFRADAEQGRLLICARSVEATSGSGTSWGIHQDDRGACEGVAGVGWFENAAFTVTDLPDLSTSPGDAEMQYYAERTFVTPDQVREQKWKARSYRSSQ